MSNLSSWTLVAFSSSSFYSWHIFLPLPSLALSLSLSPSLFLSLSPSLSLTRSLSLSLSLLPTHSLSFPSLSLFLSLCLYHPLSLSFSPSPPPSLSLPLSPCLMTEAPRAWGGEGEGTISSPCQSEKLDVCGSPPYLKGLETCNREWFTGPWWPTATYFDSAQGWGVGALFCGGDRDSQESLLPGVNMKLGWNCLVGIFILGPPYSQENRVTCILFHIFMGKPSWPISLTHCFKPLALSPYPK